MAKQQSNRVLAQNRKARHEYFVEETYECGIELKGTEVKSIRQGKVNLKESFCMIRQGEMFAEGMHISSYEQGNIFNTDPLRPKRLLLHKNEIRKLFQAVKKDGYTLIPLQLYLKNNRVKLLLGLCKGKKLHDKRETLAQRDVKRAMERAMREYK
ncbi:MAG: SsrA-binding protein SmpB [Christensenellaceae bacterium]|nr:SsrA-binding protein SmpB [Christensenellaceae bacterium]